jgi:SAM-dependent methyltransferase
MSSAAIKEVLKGLARQHQPGAELDGSDYISLGLIDRWLKNIALHEAHGVMLDYGCGGQPYKNFFLPKLTRYIGADVAAAQGVQVDLEIIPGQALSLADASIDTLLSTQTLEHLPDVHFYLKECGRLVRPGGRMILTAPMQWRHHEVPYDYLRFTKYGLSSLIEQYGFEIKSISPCGGVYALLGQIFLSHLHERGVQKKLLNRLVNSLALWLDRRFPDTEDTLNWMCIAVRKSNQ